MGTVVSMRACYSIADDGTPTQLSWHESIYMPKVGFVYDTEAEACDSIDICRDRFGLFWLKQDEMWIRMTPTQMRNLHAQLCNFIAGE